MEKQPDENMEISRNGIAPEEEISSNCISSDPVNCNLSNSTSGCHGNNTPTLTDSAVNEDTSSCPSNNNATCIHSDCSNMAYDLFAMSVSYRLLCIELPRLW